MPKTFSRKGLHRLECPMCPCYGYFTVAMLEAAGELPRCFARGCGETLQPTELELAMLLDAEDSRPMVEYRRECNSVAKGQASHYMLGHKCEAPELVAAAARGVFAAPVRPSAEDRCATARSRTDGVLGGHDDPTTDR
jgi:hypothetical protein